LSNEVSADRGGKRGQLAGERKNEKEPFKLISERQKMLKRFVEDSEIVSNLVTCHSSLKL
jgi:hypothetical protein